MAVSNVTNAWPQDQTTVTTGQGTSIDVEFIKLGCVVVMSFINGSFTANENATILTVPSGYRPHKKEIDVRDTYSNKRLLIYPDGRVVTKDALSATVIRGSFTYIAL